MTYLLIDIEQAVCKRFQLTRRDLHSHNRSRVYARPRQIMMFLCREMTKASYPKIGRYLGGRHHTTVMHGQRRIRQLMRETNTMAVEIEGVRDILHQLPSANCKAREMAALPLVMSA